MAEWLMRVEKGLKAHFKQPDGSSSPGVDWMIGLKHGEEIFTVTVRTYLSDGLAPQFRNDDEFQSNTAMRYLNDLLAQGWHPSQGGDLEITITNPDVMPAKPWWKFW